MLKNNINKDNKYKIIMLTVLGVSIISLLTQLIFSNNLINIAEISNSLQQRIFSSSIKWQFLAHNNYFLPKLISLFLINTFNANAAVVFLTINIIALICLTYKLDKTFKQKHLIKYFLIIASSFLFFDSLKNANFIIIELLIFSFFITSNSAIKSSAMLFILCLLNPLFIIIIVPIISHRRYKTIIAFLAITIFGFYFLKQDFLSALDINHSFFTIRNNISITSFIGFIGKLISNENILPARDIAIIIYFSLLLSFIAIEVIKFIKFKKIENKETSFDYFLLLPFIAGYPQYQPTSNLLYLIAMLPILKYAYENKIACISCVIGFVTFTCLALVDWQIIDLQINQKFIKIIPSFTCMMFMIWVTAINIRKTLYLKS